MTAEALAKEIPELRRHLRKISDELKAAQQELEDTNKALEAAKINLKNVQVLNDSVVQNNDSRLDQKMKELVALEADIKAAHITRADMDTGMAERLATGQQAILNQQKVEQSIKYSITALRHTEDSMRQNIANTKASMEAENSALSSLQESVVSLKQEQDRVQHWLLDKEAHIRKQENIEQREQELNKGRDYLTNWEKEVLAHERDLRVMEARLKPKYLEVYKTINSKYINGTQPERKGLQSQT